MDPYSILGIQPGASTEEIKRAYRKKAQQWHPDLNKSEEAKARFNEVQMAYESLINGKPFKATQRPQQHYRPPTQSYPGRTQPSASQQSSRQNAHHIRRVKLDKANAQRSRDREDWLGAMAVARNQASENAQRATRDYSEATDRIQRETARRLEEARIAYARLVRSIQAERDEAVRQAVTARDQKITAAQQERSRREHFANQARQASEQAFEAKIAQIQREFEADLAASR